MPSVTFIMKSGKTYSGNKESISTAQKLDTRLMVKNSSKFPIYFWLNIETTTEYRDATRKSFNKQTHSWRVNPGIINGHDDGAILRKAIAREKTGDVDLEWAKNNIKRVITTVKVSYAPIIHKNLIFKVDPETWSFDPILFQWSDPLGTLDSNIKGFEKAEISL